MQLNMQLKEVYNGYTITKTESADGKVCHVEMTHDGVDKKFHPTLDDNDLHAKEDSGEILSMVSGSIGQNYGSVTIKADYVSNDRDKINDAIAYVIDTVRRQYDRFIERRKKAKEEERKKESVTLTVTVNSENFNKAVPIVASDDGKQIILSDIFKVRVSSVSGVVSFGRAPGVLFTTDTTDELEFWRVDGVKVAGCTDSPVNSDVSTSIWQLGYKTLDLLVTDKTDNITATAYLHCVGSITPATNKLYITPTVCDISVHQSKDSLPSLADKYNTTIEITSVTVELVCKKFDVSVAPAPESDTTQPPKTVESENKPIEKPLSCCHCGKDLARASEYVVLKEEEIVIPGPGKVTLYHCCPDCYDFMRKARNHVRSQLNYVDNAKDRRVEEMWFHLFVTEAESKRKLNEK